MGADPTWEEVGALKQQIFPPDRNDIAQDSAFSNDLHCGYAHSTIPSRTRRDNDKWTTVDS